MMATQEYPRKCCYEQFPTWKRVAIAMAVLLTMLVGGAWTGGAKVYSVERDIADMQREQQKILDLWADADTIKREVRAVLVEVRGRQ